MERRITEIETPAIHIFNKQGKGNNMLTSMFNTLFPSTKKEKQTMANSTQYVVYTSCLLYTSDAADDLSV